MRLIEFSWKDFKKNKVKSIFGIAGIMISIFLLSTVGILIDSLSFTYLDLATSQAGSADIMFSKNISPDSIDFYMDQNYIESNLDVDEIDYFFPRLLMTVDMQSEYIDEPYRQIFYGLNTSLEQSSGKLGDLFICDPDTLEPTSQPFIGPLQDGHCIVLKGLAESLNVTVGDWIELTYTGSPMNVTVEAVCEQNLRFSIIETQVLIVELPEAQDFIGVDGQVNYVLATLKDREYIYDSRDIDGTTERIRDVGTKIQQQIGFDYSILLPKMQQLEISEFANMTMELMMIFVTVLCIMISGILINSILSTSVEERIKEFGIMRILGGYSRNNVKMVLYQGLFMGIFGSILGIIASVFAVPPLLTLIFNGLELWEQPIPFIVLPATVVQSAALGILSTVVISIFPALKSGKIKITDAIDPFRQSNDTDYVLTKEGSTNSKIIIFGIAISTVGILLFIMFPRIMALQDMSAMIQLFMFLMIAILLGFVCAFLGVVPAVEWLLLQVFKPFIKKYSSVVALSLKRNRRRNTGNVLMFSLTFSFIFFISSFLTIRSEMVNTSMEFQYGADLVIINQGSYEQGNAIDYDFFQKITSLQGIKNAAPVVHNTLDATELLSVASSSLMGGEMDMTSIASVFMGVFESDKYETFVGDIAASVNLYCGLIGVNQSYVDLSNEDYMMWDDDSNSNTEDCFEALFDSTRNDTVIIAKNVADLVGVTEIGQKVRLTFADSSQSQYTGNVTTMTVVGITKGMPGFWNFRSGELSAYMGGGVMMSINNYLSWMDEDIKLQGGNDQDQKIDKILFNLEDTTEDGIEDAKQLIDELYSEEYSFIVDDNISKIEMMNEGTDTTQLIIEIILLLTVLIALFGLISTMYSTLLERMYEIGLLRSMGLRTNDVRGMFIVESLIMMISSGLMGMFVGSFLAYEMVSNVSVITEMPTPYAIDFQTLLSTFSLSIAVCVIGIILITRNIKRWSIMDIFRQTF